MYPVITPFSQFLLVIYVIEVDEADCWWINKWCPVYLRAVVRATTETAGRTARKAGCTKCPTSAAESHFKEPGTLQLKQRVQMVHVLQFYQRLRQIIGYTFKESYSCIHTQCLQHIYGARRWIMPTSGKILRISFQISALRYIPIYSTQGRRGITGMQVTQAYSQNPWTFVGAFVIHSKASFPLQIAKMHRYVRYTPPCSCGTMQPKHLSASAR